MEQNQNTSLFGLSIEPVTKAHLSETAKWAKFLAIMGFIGMGLIAVVFVFALIFGTSSTSLTTEGETRAVYGGLAASFQFLFLFLMVALYFFPCLFLLRFANKMKMALASDNQDLVNSSFHNLKRLFKFLGILTIIILAFYAVILVVALLGIGMSR